MEEAREGRIDLAVLDILLPDMDGRSVYPELIQRRPDLKVIVTSGYSVEGPAQELLDAGARAFLPKPFSLQELRETITRVLGDAPSLSGRP
jgi:two-component system, cell cycle sensor histidine kinase and response regulator CckA